MHMHVCVWLIILCIRCLCEKNIFKVYMYVYIYAKKIYMVCMCIYRYIDIIYTHIFSGKNGIYGLRCIWG